MAQVRYIVSDVGAAVAFYTGALAFDLRRQYGPVMAIVARGDLELWLAGPAASASRPMPDGAQPAPGGWGRIVLQVQDLPALVDRLTAAGVRFRNTILDGPGGRQILCCDPAGNLVETVRVPRLTSCFSLAGLLLTSPGKKFLAWFGQTALLRRP